MPEQVRTLQSQYELLSKLDIRPHALFILKLYPTGALLHAFCPSDTSKPLTPATILDHIAQCIQLRQVDGVCHRPEHVLFSNTVDGNQCGRTLQEMGIQVGIASVAQGFQQIVLNYSQQLYGSPLTDIYAQGALTLPIRTCSAQQLWMFRAFPKRIKFIPLPCSHVQLRCPFTMQSVDCISSDANVAMSRVN